MGGGADACAAQEILRQAQPPPAAHDDPAPVARAVNLLGNPPVAYVDHAIDESRGAGIVRHDDGRGAVLERELANEREERVRVVAIELARRLVREQEPGTMRERCADGSALLLAPGQLPRARVRARAEADSLQQLVCPRVGGARRDAVEPETQSHQRSRRQIGIEGSCVVLVDPPDRLRAIARERPRLEARDLRAEHLHAAGRRTVQAGEQPEEGRLAGTARADDRQEPAFRDPERKPLQRGCVALGRRVDAKDVPQDDRVAHPAASARPASAPAKPRRDRIATSAPATGPTASAPRSSAPPPRASVSGGTGRWPPAVTATTDTTSIASAAPTRSPPPTPNATTRNGHSGTSRGTARPRGARCSSAATA